MTNTTQETAFEALDACHRKIQAHLVKLTALAELVDGQELDTKAKKQAGVIERFFSGTSRQHHVEEERSVFPILLASGNPELVTAVKSLQQDHGWIEENWLELAPQLRALASGNNWVDPSEFQHGASVFVELCRGHIALEETLIYPHSKARWAQAVAARRTRSTAE
jgi:hemerythrin-like domain-containing protein